MAAEFGALSADHLEHIDEEGVGAMARAKMVAVLLPGAFYALSETRKPPVEMLRRYGVPMAVATDCNPGTSPVLSPTLMLNMACTLFGLTPEEAVAGMTREGARALGLQDEIGIIAPGKAADLVVLTQDPLADIRNTARIAGVAIGGRWLTRAELDRMIEAATTRINDR
jgi:imidazolonepropionase